MHQVGVRVLPYGVPSPIWYLDGWNRLRHHGSGKDLHVGRSLDGDAESKSSFGPVSEMQSTTSKNSELIARWP